VELIGQGANSTVFRDGNIVEKKYGTFTSTEFNRGQNEFDIISYLWDSGCRCIPQPHSFNAETNTGKYGFIEGKKLEINQITSKHIKEMIDFLVYSKSLTSGWTGIGKEPCLATYDYRMNLEGRIIKLLAQKGESKLNKEAKLIAKIIEDNLREKKDSLDLELLPKEQLMFNPGDFGVHNTIIRDDKLVFIDLEYAGIDDIIRPGMMFITHPTHLEISSTLLDEFEEEYKKQILTTDEDIKRFNNMLYYNNLHWALIQLNFILPGHPKMSDAYKEDRIQTAMNYIRRANENNN